VFEAVVEQVEILMIQLMVVHIIILAWVVVDLKVVKETELVMVEKELNLAVVLEAEIVELLDLH
jgi:hypothetical protein